MKTKNNHKHVSIHMRIERFFRHRIFLTIVLGSMAITLIKYEAHLVSILQHSYYGSGLSLLSTYTPHHEEVLRMPVVYGTGVRNTTTSDR